MADEGPAQEDKTEDPTSRRLDQARERGEFPRSQDLGGALVVVAVCLLIYLLGHQIADELKAVIVRGLSLDWQGQDYGADLSARAGRMIVDGLWSIRWIFVLSVVSVFAAALANGGIHISAAAAAPKFDRLNPLNGLKRMFGRDGWISVAKNLVKFSVIGVVLFTLLWFRREDFLSIASRPLEGMVEGGALLAFSIFLMLSLVIGGLGLADLPLQRYSFMQRMRMSKQEVRDERKDVDGRPEVKQRIRRRQREISRSSMLGKVREADVVIVNPMEFAVAIVYDEAKSSVPMLLAKGRGDIAAVIKQRARDAAVPIVEAPPLARALYYTCEIDRQIPEGLYRPVATVLAYVYQVSAMSSPSESTAAPNPAVPEEFRFDEAGRPQASP